MSSRIFFGIRIPDRSYSLIHMDFEDTKKSILDLKTEIAQKIEFPKDDIEFLLNGNILEDTGNLSTINPNSLIHVLKKTPVYQPYTSNKTYTKEDCKQIAELFGTVTNVGINVGVRINILAHIISEYPEFRRNLGAQALIRDSVLFHSLDKPEVIEKVAENYSIICDAAEFIVKITKKELAKNANVSLCDESFTDTTSSSEEENSNTNQSEQARIRRISRDQLAAALSAIGTSSLNSLSNIAQRNSNLAEQFEHDQGQNVGYGGGTSSVQSIAPNRISSSLLNNALTQALLGTTNNNGQTQPVHQRSDSESMDTTETQQNDDNHDLPLRYRNHEFAGQMRIMRDMGLIDDEINLNVLLITNGNVENAINLVLTSSDLGYPASGQN